MRSFNPRFVPISTDVVDIPVEGMFASADWRVIAKEGDNYYKACGEVVDEKEDGSTTTCVKPIHHVTWTHEDIHGCVNSDRQWGVKNIDEQTRHLARDILKRTGLDDEQIYNALNALFFNGVNLVKEKNE